MLLDIVRINNKRLKILNCKISYQLRYILLTEFVSHVPTKWFPTLELEANCAGAYAMLGVLALCRFSKA